MMCPYHQMRPNDVSVQSDMSPDPSCRHGPIFCDMSLSTTRHHDCHVPPACMTACPNPRAPPKAPGHQPDNPQAARSHGTPPAAVHPTVTRSHAHSTHLVCQMTCPTLGNISGHIVCWPGVTQAARSVPIMRPPTVKCFALATSWSGVHHCTLRT